MINSEKLVAFNNAAHKYYLKNTSKSFDDLNDYLSYETTSWADGLHGDEWETIEQAEACGIEAASQYLEKEIGGIAK